MAERKSGRRKASKRVNVEFLETRTLLSGTWTALSHAAPGSVGTMLLLPNGSVMTTVDGDGAGSDWGLLTPDATGSYVNGTWTKLANANDTRLFDASQVLPDGRVFVAGGEYGTGAATGETYNPLTNTWTRLPSQSYGSFIDANSIMLPNGNVLIAPVAPNPSGYTTIFHPSTNTWSQGPKLYRGGSADEQSWVKLSDDSVLMTDGNGTSERYVPSLNQWINDGTVPVSLFDKIYEEGAGVRLADGRALFLGATGHTAIYTPTGTTSPGTWVAGPDIPGSLGTDDAPVAVLPDGTVLCAVGPTGGFNSPTTFYLFNPTTNSFSLAPSAPNSGGVPFVDRMLDLPNGQVLFTNNNSTLYVYSPGTTPLAIAQPSITSIVNNPDGSLTLTGTGLNGLDAGAAYGDDAQMDSNYPLISLSLGSSVYYARSYNWSSTSIDTGTLAETVNFTLPLGIAPGTYSVTTAANGVTSAPVLLSISTTANNVAPTIAIAAAATPTPVNATTTALSVLGADDAGESNLTYTWTTISSPAGYSLPSFSINGSNAAKNTTVTFHRAGSYTFKVIVTDAGGLSVSSAVSVLVNAVENHLNVTPAVGDLSANGSEQLTAQAIDQFGYALATQPGFTWSVVSGGGTISTAGRYTAPAVGTLATVKAANATFSGTAQVGVVPAPWSNTDIGSTGVTGLGYTQGAAPFTIEGSGSDIWGTADAFHFVYQTLSGDGSITARVASQQNTNGAAKSGVMIRNSLSSTDQYVLMATYPTGGVTMQDRTTSGGTAVQAGATAGVTAPYWVRLVRSGTTLTGYRSADGRNWITEGVVTISMGTTAYFGLAVCAHNNSVLNTSTFDNVAVAATPPNFGFETPSLGTGAAADYAYNPTGASWTFSGTSGIAANGSTITAGNPNAPQGTQVAFLEQTGSSIGQTVTLVGGTDAITFSAAQKAGNAAPQNFEVLVDGNVLAVVTPTGTNYATYSTKAFVATAGTHTLFFDALDSAGGDNVALIDNVNVDYGTSVKIALTTGTNPTSITQPLTFTATVSSGVANGETVLLEDASNNNAVVASGTLSAGIATLTAPAGSLAAGTHNLIAVYGGDTNFAAEQSAVFSEVVQAAPVVTGNPANLSVTVGQTATFTAAASGNPVPIVQWQVSTDGGNTFTNVSGATSTTYSFAAALAQSGNEYRAVFTNVQGSATTAAATLTVVAQPVTVTLTDSNPNPSDATQSLAFTATVSGGVPDGEAVTLQDSSNSNAFVATGTLSGGTATFTVPAGTLLAGTHNLIAVYGGDANFAAGQSTALAQTVQVVVTAVTVNGNLPVLAGVQRSMVNSIVYTFSEAVNVAAANAFSIAVTSGQSGTVPTLNYAALNPNADGSSTQWVVTFSGAGVIGGSIADGVYDITLNASAATSDVNATVTSQPRTTDTFYRLFGDAQGTGKVNTADYTAFLSTFGLKNTSAGYLGYFAADGTTKIDAADYNAFLANFGKKVSGFIATI